MTRNGNEQPRGPQLRRRVRGLTWGVTGAAVLASAGVTATIAYSQSRQTADTSAAGLAVDNAGGSDDSAASAGSARSNDDGESDDSISSSGSGGLAAPIQPPTWWSGTGGGSITGHANSGGS